MKEILLVSFAFLAFGFTSISLAAGNVINTNPNAFATLTRKFSEAREISWNNTGAYVKATFKLNEQVMFAYFNSSGELLGVSRHMLSTQLPIMLQNRLKKNYPGSWITELFEFAGEDSSNYYATIENAGQKLMLINSGTSEWAVLKKLKKY